METRIEQALAATRFSVVGNILLAGVKWIAGIFGNSYALVADAIESTTDIGASLLVWAGLRYAARPADKNHPYGHGRLEPLITFLVVGFLIASAVFIAHEAIVHIRTPHAPPEPWTLGVLAAIILWKEGSYRWVIRRSRETGSSALAADAWHHRSDAITSVAAFAGITAALLLGPGFEEADDWAALFASVFILYNAWGIFRPALGELMDEHVHDDMIAAIRETAESVSGVAGTEKCFVRKAGMRFHVDLHAEVDGEMTVTEGHEIAHRISDAVCAAFPEVAQVLVHIEPAGIHSLQQEPDGQGQA
jgi:cation diffusion facilitator family transporter